MEYHVILRMTGQGASHGTFYSSLITMDPIQQLMGRAMGYAIDHSMERLMGCWVAM